MLILLPTTRLMSKPPTVTRTGNVKVLAALSTKNKSSSTVFKMLGVLKRTYSFSYMFALFLPRKSVARHPHLFLAEL